MQNSEEQYKKIRNLFLATIIFFTGTSENYARESSIIIIVAFFFLLL